MKKTGYCAIAVLLLLALSACGQTKREGSVSESTASIVRNRESEKKDATDSSKEKGENGQMEQDDKKTAADIAFDFETKTVTLNSGYQMPINGIGTYSLEGDTCIHSVSEALSRGVRLIDTAYMYHNEAEVGESVRDSGIPREEIFVTTKLYPNQFSEPERAIDEALEKLNLGYIDLMLLHHPGTDDVKAYKAMEKAVADGKIRSIGLSNWYVEELEELLSDKVISSIAEAHGKSSAQVILRWNLQKGVVVIPGSSNPDHIQENTELYDFELSDEEMEQINALDRNEKHDWY